MSKKLQNIILISLLAGGITGIASLIPHLTKIFIIFLFTLISVPIIFLLKRKFLVDIPNEIASLKLGALIGTFSTLGFGLTFYPIIYIMSLFIQPDYLGGLGLMVRLMNFGLAVLFIIFVCVISATINAFSALMYYYIKESVKNLK